MTITTLPQTFTEAELAAHLGVHPETLARERRRGRLSYVRIGKKIRYTPAHVAAYLAAQECATTSSSATASGKSAGPTHLDARKANQLAREIAGKPNSH